MLIRMSEICRLDPVHSAGLGAPGLFLVAFLDSSFLSLPEIIDISCLDGDAAQVAMLLYAASATLGRRRLPASLLMGRKGGQFVMRRFSADRVERALELFRRYGVMAVLIPSLLPPPMPFKIFVLLAGVAGISAGRFASRSRSAAASATSARRCWRCGTATRRWRSCTSNGRTVVAGAGGAAGGRAGRVTCCGRRRKPAEPT